MVIAMNYKSILIPLLLIPAVQSVEALTSHDSRSSLCLDSTLPSGGVAGISAGVIQYCIHTPDYVADGATFYVAHSMTGPVVTAGVVSISFQNFPQLRTGCTVTTGAIRMSNFASGLIATQVDTYTMTGRDCSFTVAPTLNLGAIPVTVYQAELAVTVSVRDLDNRNRLCDHSAFASACEIPDLWTHQCGTSEVVGSSTKCTAPFNATPPTNYNVALSGDLDVHQDQACGNPTPCLIDQNLNISVGSVNQNNSFQQTPTPFEVKFGLTGLEFLFLIACLVAFVVVWSKSQDALVRIMMGFLTFVLGLLWMEIWFGTHSSVEFLIMVINFIIGLYLLARMGYDALTAKP